MPSAQRGYPRTPPTHAEPTTPMGLPPPYRAGAVSRCMRAAVVAVTLCAACTAIDEGGTGGELVIGVLGDAPYYWWEEARFDHLMQVIDQDSLDVLIHVGDIFWRPCSGDKMRERRETLLSQRHPVVFTPGDNEWTDCWGRSEGGHVPLERLDTLRTVFFPRPGQTLGRASFEVAHQGADPEWSEFVENARWTMSGVIFATIHMVGSWNALSDFPGRRPADDEASERRTLAGVTWLRQTFAEARETGARGVFLVAHAFPDPATYSQAHIEAYEPYLRTLEEEVAAFEGPVVLAHGDDHHYTVDHPLIDRRTGRTLANFTRLQVMGSPDVGWVRVVMNPYEVDLDGEAGSDSEEDTVTFTFTPRTVAGWRIW